MLKIYFKTNATPSLLLEFRFWYKGRSGPLQLHRHWSPSLTPGHDWQPVDNYDNFDHDYHNFDDDEDDDYFDDDNGFDDEDEFFDDEDDYFDDDDSFDD